MASGSESWMPELQRGGGGGGGESGFFPVLVGVVGRSTAAAPDRIVLVNPMTQDMVVLQGDASMMAAILSDGHRGPPAASRASIEAMRAVEGGGELECAVCLDAMAGEAKEMPCKHRFHGECIERWLGVNGTCPVCRFQMPVEEEAPARKGGGEEAAAGVEEMRWRRGRVRREVWITIAVGGRRLGDGLEEIGGGEEAAAAAAAEGAAPVMEDD